LFDLVMAIIFVLFFVTVDDTSPFFSRERVDVTSPSHPSDVTFSA
jgi:hypothetical protein